MALPNSPIYDLQTLIDGVTFNGTMTSYISAGADCFPWGKYSLFFTAQSTGTGGHLVTIDVEMSPDDGVTWYKYGGSLDNHAAYSTYSIRNQDASGGLLAAIVGEWTATSKFRLSVVATNTAAERTITLTAKAQFWR